MAPAAKPKATKQRSAAKTEAAPDSGRRRRPIAGETAARKQVIETALAMSRSGLSPGRSGNVSLRWDGGMLITPSGVAYDTLKPADIVYVGAGGKVPSGQLKPSSEWQFHLAALDQRPDRDAVVHAHSLNAVVLACRHEPIPAFHYMVALAGGTDIPVVPYALFGSRELAAHVAEGVSARDACLLANHGQVALGATLEAALELAYEVETLAAQYVQVLALGGPKLLSDAEMRAVLERVKTYGQHAQGDA